MKKIISLYIILFFISTNLFSFTGAFNTGDLEMMQFSIDGDATTGLYFDVNNDNYNDYTFLPSYIQIECDTVNDYQGKLIFPDVTGDREWSIPDISGTFLMTTSSAIPAAGSDGQVQYNDNGWLGADSGFITDKSGSLTLSGTMQSANATVTSLNTANGIVQTDGSGNLSSSIALPNGTTCTTQSPGTGTTLAASCAYADAAVSAEDFWDRTGTKIEPKNAGDDLDIGTGVFDVNNIDINGSVGSFIYAIDMSGLGDGTYMFIDAFGSIGGTDTDNLFFANGAEWDPIANSYRLIGIDPVSLIELTDDGTIDFKTNSAGSPPATITPTTRMTIKNSGNIGIGTTGDDVALEINKATGGTLRLTYNDSNGSATVHGDLDVDDEGNLQLSATGGLVLSTTNAYGAMVIADTTDDMANPLNGLVSADYLYSDGYFGFRAIKVYNTQLNGWGDFLIGGAANDAGSPIVCFWEESDNYVDMQQGSFAHDHSFLNFDCYYDGATSTIKSSDAGSNFQIVKQGDTLSFKGDTGIAQGSTCTLDTFFSITNTNVTFSTLNTANGIVQTDGSGNLSSSTVLPDGTTCTTQSPGTGTTLAASCAYADAAVSAEDFWDRTGTTLYPHTATDLVSMQRASIGPNTGETSPTNLVMTQGGYNVATTVGGQDFRPASVINTSSSRGGYMAYVGNDYLDLANVDGHFVSVFPYNDSVSSDDGSWKAFKLMTGSTATDKFWVNKYGAGFFNSTVRIVPGTYVADGVTPDTRTDAVGVFDLDDTNEAAIYWEEDDSLRNLISINKSIDTIDIGQTGTALLDVIRLMPGNTGYLQFYSNGNETVRITDDKVGFNQTIPTTLLHAKGFTATDCVLFLEPSEWNSTGDYSEVRFGDTTHYIRGEYGNGMTFYDWNEFTFSYRGTEKIVIDSDSIDLKQNTNVTGTLGINTTAPDADVEINNASGGSLRLTYNDSDGTAATHADMNVDSSGIMNVSSTGNILYSTASIGVGTNSPINKSHINIGSASDIGYIIENANIRGGVELESYGTTNLDGILNVGINTNRAITEKTTNDPGAWFRVDTRAADPCFSWFFEASGSDVEHQYMKLDIDSTNGGNLFIGGTGTPDGKIHVYEEGLITTRPCMIHIEQGTSGGTEEDAVTRYEITGAQLWTTGIDNSDSDKYKISASSALGTTDVIVSTTAGEITTPLQPCFFAYNSATDSNVTGDGTTYTCEFDSEIYDQNADFNTTTDTFTVPVTGRYLFSVGIGIGGILSSHNNGAIALVTSNRTYYLDTSHAYNVASSAGVIARVFTCYADMDASDTAYVQITESGGTKVIDYYGTDGDTTVMQCFFQGELVA